MLILESYFTFHTAQVDPINPRGCSAGMVGELAVWGRHVAGWELQQIVAGSDYMYQVRAVPTTERERERERERTWWAHTGGGHALAFKQPT